MFINFHQATAMNAEFCANTVLCNAMRDKTVTKLMTTLSNPHWLPGILIL